LATRKATLWQHVAPFLDFQSTNAPAGRHSKIFFKTNAFRLTRMSRSDMIVAVKFNEALKAHFSDFWT